MAYRINPTPSEGVGSATTKKKKEPTSGYVTNTATPPPQPAPEVTNTTNTTPTAKSGFIEDVPKPLQPSAAQVSAAKQSIANQNTANQSTVNNNQNTTLSTNTAKTVSYDSTPIPQTQLKTTKPQVQANYVYTEPKTNTANQYTSPYNGYMGQSITNTATQGVKQISVQNTTPQYSTKDRVDNAWGTASVETTKTDWNKLFGINKNTDYWGYPKTIKDGAEPKVNTVKTPEINYGINREIAETTPKVDDSIRQIYIEYLKRGLSEGVGISNETAQSNFLDHRGQNAIEKIIERNPFDTVQETQFVTKDNVYEQTPERIKTELTNTGTLVNNEISDLKRQREDLLFEVQYGRRNSSDPELEKVNYDIEYLQHIENKVKMGLKYSYAFETEDLDRLSKMSVDDILNSKEEFNQNLPYLSPWAKTVRVAGKGVSAHKNSVGVVDSIGVKYIKKDNKFRVFDKENQQNYFEFNIDNEFNPKGYYESKIVVGEHTDIPNDKIYYDLAESLDGLVVSGKVKKQLEYFAEISDRPKLNFDGLGVTDIASYALDVIDLLVIIASDYWEDQEVGIDSTQATFGTIGAWGGNILGSVEGAKIGASLGLAGGPPGAVIGGVLGAAFGAYLLSSALEDLGRYLGENINESEYPIERYYERGK